MEYTQNFAELIIGLIGEIRNIKRKSSRDEFLAIHQIFQTFVLYGSDCSYCELCVYFMDLLYMQLHRCSSEYQ